MNTGMRLPRAVVAAAMGSALIVASLATGLTAFAAGTVTVGLGTAAPFAILAGTPAITNTGASAITGDVGIAPALAVTGFPPGTINGTIHKGDAVAIQAKSDLTAAYTDAAGRSTTATHATLDGLSLAAGVYTAGGSTLGLTGTLTLDGQNDPNSVWIFQATSDLVTASSSTVRIINGGSACNVFWQVTSSATLGAGSTFVGTILALTSITMADGVNLNGRALAQNGDVTLINDQITAQSCSGTAPTAAPRASGSRPSTPPTDAIAGSNDTRTPSNPTFLIVGIIALTLGLLLIVREPARKVLNR